MADFVAASDLLSLRFVYPDGKDFLRLNAPPRVLSWYTNFISSVPAAQEVHDIMGKLANKSHEKNKRLFEFHPKV